MDPLGGAAGRLADHDRVGMPVVARAFVRVTKHREMFDEERHDQKQEPETAIELPTEQLLACRGPSTRVAHSDTQKRLTGRPSAREHLGYSERERQNKTRIDRQRDKPEVTDREPAQ